MTEKKKNKESVVYAIADGNDKIIYIGKTKNFNKRKENYVHPSSCHNVALKEWLLNNVWHFIILEYNPVDINLSEKKYIQEYSETLFNMVHGGDQNWRHHDRLPWMASNWHQVPK